MNLHITHDNVFIDYIINAAETLGKLDENKFCVYLYPNEEKPVKVKSSKAEYAQFINGDFDNLIGKWDQYERVFIHWMHGITCEMALKVPKHIKLTWCFWGGDGLELPSLLKWVYQPYSYKLFKQMSRKKLRVSYTGLKQFYWRTKSESMNNKIQIKAIRRVDYFAHYLKHDYDLVKSAAKSEMKHVNFFYAPCEEMAASGSGGDGKDILLGNSDTITNNHMEAIDVLKKIGLNGRKVICPLSYEKGEYAKIIQEYGTRMLGDSFVPLIDFVEREEYNKMLANVGFALMNHNRSQALGNIYTLLDSGVKLFMSKDSSLYKFFKEKGFVIFTIQDDLVMATLVPLTQEQKDLNKKLMYTYFSRKVHLENIEKLLSIN